MVDGQHILRSQTRTRLQSDEHTSLSRLLGLEENRVLGESQVHARLIHLGQRHHGPLQFSFKRAPVINVFGKFGGPQVHFVEELEANPSGLWQPDGRHAQPDIGQARRRYQDRTAAVGQAVIHARFLELLNDSGGIFRRQPGE